MRLTLSWFLAYDFENYCFGLVIIPPFLEDIRCWTIFVHQVYDNKIRS